MGNVNSRSVSSPGALYLRDQTKLSISSLVITNQSGATILVISPNGYPASQISAKRDAGDNTPIEFIQDPDPANNSSGPSFILRLTNEDELNFCFTFVIRQEKCSSVPTATTVNGVSSALPTATDNVVKSLTFAYAANEKELDNLVTREFHANPNLQNNQNVRHVGTFETGGTPSVQFTWTWKWKPPATNEAKCGGWRNCCSFLDYDERANRLNTLAWFQFWVQGPPRPSTSPSFESTGFELTVPQRNRQVSSHSNVSRTSDPNESNDELVPTSSALESHDCFRGYYFPKGNNAVQNVQPSTTAFPGPKVDVACHHPGEDMCTVDDGPLFRATMKSLEQKTGTMRTRMKKLLKKAEAAYHARIACHDSVHAFLKTLSDTAKTNAPAIQPALDHYYDRAAREILISEQQNADYMHEYVVRPLSRLYHQDIKQADVKKKEFDDESRDYYAYVSKYLGQRQDSLKEKKRVESDSKYQNKRRKFELKRFDYSSFMQDLTGGKREQELLASLTQFAVCQANAHISTSKIIESLLPHLDALVDEVNKVDKEFKFQRTEREEKRRLLENSTKKYIEPEAAQNPGPPPPTSGGNSTTNNNNNNATSYNSDSDLGRADSTNSTFRGYTGNAKGRSNSPTGGATVPTGSNIGSVSSTQNRFKGFRDLEERDTTSMAAAESTNGQQKKEGLLWALSRPGSHIDPKGINKQAWHKFWIVLDQGKLSEYSNWKQKLDLHMDPIDLRMASVREARNAERRFCFEVITPQFKRIYQATSEQDMKNWINAINNALQSAVEGRLATPRTNQTQPKDTTPGRTIGSALIGKSVSSVGHQGTSPSNTSNMGRRTTVGARPGYMRSGSHGYDDDPAKLLQTIHTADQGNTWCADCCSTSKVEWVSINLGIVLCIECSGIHRSLGTHISKVRSLTLDIHSFSNDIVEILLQVGNRVSNMVWEAQLGPGIKPGPTATREQRLKFITAKYSDRAFVRPLSPTLSKFSTAEETLLASIKQNDIQGVLYGIALRADLNATDLSRKAHPVFLALAAADPAPAGTPPASPNLGRQAPIRPFIPSRSSSSSTIAKPFPVAELLVQNGAVIPPHMPAFALSEAAQLYLTQRTIRSSRLDGGGNGTGDTLSALPTIRGPEGNGSSMPAVDSKERERLQKRGSAGARFAGKVSSLAG
ncbi:ARF GTPase activator protein Csx2 [Nannizzia gypsea CBS 118893]|uniref:ADP-ribosylation factor GTPase-activating protein n=1 Tax=Arthroderma gypseum (strain ATCC MYA-4604 / CBS 118893) TaxID=535722 RepID=E4UWV3_ARTGP|nr:ARF GTPase activator protein Csx2 [Nannizzia gypsea CBS 118893]EFR01806.1 ARF GTPase activator protein Csx2 [Nannizzia gypsea CBS 118893]